jgi:AraC-like DNA-binding protein
LRARKSYLLRLHLIRNMADLPPPPTRVWHRSPAALGDGRWPEAFISQALCLHLNFSGEGRLHWRNGRQHQLAPMTLVWSRGVTRAERLPGRDGHECLTLVYPDGWLNHTLRDAHGQVKADRRPFVQAPFRTGLLQGRVLTQNDRAWAQARMAPHLCDQARQLLDGSRLTDFLVHELFLAADEPDLAPVSRTMRVAKERVDRAKAEMLRHIDEVPSLESLAMVAGCSPHYLSRTFTQIEGVPLSLWLRRVRMDRASELISSGQCNVSEAALEVGYRSLSHFSRAFAEEKGVAPSRWVDHLGSLRDPAMA